MCEVSWFYCQYFLSYGLDKILVKIHKEQRGITPTWMHGELYHLLIAHLLTILYVWMHSQDSTLKASAVMLWTRRLQKNEWKGDNSAKNENRVTTLTDCTSTNPHQRLCVVSWLYLQYFLSYGPDKILGRTDGRTDGPLKANKGPQIKGPQNKGPSKRFLLKWNYGPQY